MGGVLQQGVNRFAVGTGMVPRGEVGLIFAGIGLTLTVQGEAAIDQPTHSAVAIMVMITTLIIPPLLQATLSRHASDPCGPKRALD